MENIDTLKRRPEQARLKYKLRNANVYVSQGGYHFIDYLDPVDTISSEIDGSKLTEQEYLYIEDSLQSNSERFARHVTTLTTHLGAAGSRVIDIGCGGGLFLSLLESAGADVVGIELSDSRAYYCQLKHGIEVYKHPIESSFWQDDYSNHFDAATLWDVIEHVNFPLETLQSVSNVLKRGGLLFIDTPCRESIYHRVGEITYRLSKGRYPTFLNAMYSAHLFGHKQIFSRLELAKLFQDSGLAIVEITRFHELSFPCEFYLKRLIKSDRLVRVSVPWVELFFRLFKLRNKMLIIGRKC